MSKQSLEAISERYLTVVQAAERLSVHASTIRRWIDEGRLAAYRLGEKRIGVRPSDLAGLVARRAARPRGGRMARSERRVIPRLTKEEQQRGLRALAELERLSSGIAATYGKLAPESWELINQGRDERTRDLLQTADE